MVIDLATRAAFLAALLVAHAAMAQENGPDVNIDIEVIAKRLDEARQQIQPNLGATS